MWPSDLDKWGRTWKRERRVSQKFSDSKEMLSGWLLKIMGLAEPDHFLQREQPPISYLCSIWEFWAGISNKSKSYWIGLKLNWLQGRINVCLTQETLRILSTSHRATPHTHSNSEGTKIYINIGKTLGAFCTRQCVLRETEERHMAPSNLFYARKVLTWQLSTKLNNSRWKLPSWG